MKGGALSRHRLNHILKDGPVHFELDKILGFASRIYLKEKSRASLLPLPCARKYDGWVTPIRLFLCIFN